MTTIAGDELVEIDRKVFDPLDREARADPYPYYRRLRELAPVYSSDTLGMWVVSGYADCHRMLSDHAVWSSDMRLARTRPERLAERGIAGGGMSEAVGQIMMFMDPPDHTRVRGAVNRAFTPRRMAGLTPVVEGLVDEMLAKGDADGGFDLVADLATPLPIAVIGRLIGVPPSDDDQLTRWTLAIASMLDFRIPDEQYRKAGEAVLEFCNYCLDLIAARRREPEDDLVSVLVHIDDADHQLAPGELLMLLVLLLAAGNLTTMNLLGTGAWTLLCRPEALALLREDPAARIDGAVEELLRYESPAQMIPRIALADSEIAGHKVAAGDQALAMAGGANRDPAEFVDPERFDMFRSDARHLAFSHGVHFCVGAALARIELRVAFTKLFERFPTIRLATEDLEWQPTATARGLVALPVEL
jgi:cytochrome P450